MFRSESKFMGQWTKSTQVSVQGWEQIHAAVYKVDRGKCSGIVSNFSFSGRPFSACCSQPWRLTRALCQFRWPHLLVLRRRPKMSLFMGYKNDAQRASLSLQQLLASESCFLALFHPHPIPPLITTSFWFNIFIIQQPSAPPDISAL